MSTTTNYNFKKEKLGHPMRDDDIGDNLDLIDAAIASRPSAATLVVAASDSLHKERADYVCPGVDDQDTFSAAITALPDDGGKVVLLEGTYNFTGVTYTTNILTITKSNVTIEGQGKATHIKVVGNEGRYVIYFNGVSNCVIRDLWVDGNTLGRNAIQFTNSSECKVLNCIAGNTWADGIVGTNLSYSLIKGNIVYDCQTSGHGDASSGIELEDGCNHINVEDNYLKDCAAGIWSKRHPGSPLTHDISIVRNTLYDSRITVSSEDAEPLESINVIGNTLLGATTCKPISVNDAINSIIRDNTLYSPVHDSGGIYVDGGATHTLVDGNMVYDASTNGIFVGGNGSIISNNHISGSGNNGIKASNDGGVVSGNIVENSGERGIYIAACKSSITGNIVKNSAQAGIRVHNTSDITLTGNVCFDDQGVKTQTYGIELSQYEDACDYITVIGNMLRGNLTDGLHVVTGVNIHGKVFDKYIDLFMDVLAVSATHVRSNEDLSAATPITFTIDAQPDVPRTLSGHFDSHAQITEYDIEIIGVDAKGNTITETKDETDGWDWETNNAFATITSIKMTSRTGTGAGDTMDIGITDVLGISNIIYATGDVYKIKKNNANATVAAAQVNTTYDTYDMAVIGLAGGDDFTIWFKSNLNIIS